MTKKRKSKKEKPGERAMAADDYGNVLRFLFAGLTDAGWRDKIASGKKAKVKAALTSIGVSFPNHADLDAVVDACQNISAVPGTWNLFDNLRTTLLGPGGTGAA